MPNIKSVKYHMRKVLLWLVVVNGFLALAIVVANQNALYLPEYNQGYWWAWKTAFLDAPINIVFIIVAFVAGIFLLLDVDKRDVANAKH